MTSAICVALVTATLAVANGAVAGTAAPTLSGTARGGAAPHDRTKVVFTYTVQTQGDLQGTSLTSHQDGALPVAGTGVTLDGQPVPSGEFTVIGDDIVIESGDLAAGTHTYTFDATVAGETTATTSSTATFSWTGGSTDSNAVTLDVNVPDVLAYPNGANNPDSTRQGPQYLGTGEHITYRLKVSNSGWGDEALEWELDLPKDVGIASKDGPATQASCRHGANKQQAATGSTGKLGHGQIFTKRITLTTCDKQHPGETVFMRWGAGPRPGHLGNDYGVILPLTLTGTARLRAHVNVAPHKVTVGDSITVTPRIHDLGPRPTRSARQQISIDLAHLKITHLGKSLKVISDGDTATVTWFAGSFDVGQERTNKLELKATSAGKASITSLGAQSVATNPLCNSATGCTTDKVTVTISS
jgi:hypothetical protein